MRKTPALVLLLLPAVASWADDPVVEHQPALCTVPDKPMSLCATISADRDRNVAWASIYFKRPEEINFSFVSMAFTGVTYCGTLPGPLEKTKVIEYHISAVDDAGQSGRTSDFRIEVKPEGACGFPPLEKDKTKATAIRVIATDHKQGKKLDDGFNPTGVTFVPRP